VRENTDAHHECLDHYLDLFHLCNGKIMDTDEPINHTKLLGKWGYKIKHFL
jgi:predicted RNA-binding protein associated with RNAse of E/G family